jgi:hypothetical protein
VDLGESSAVISIDNVVYTRDRCVPGANLRADARIRWTHRPAYFVPYCLYAVYRYPRVGASDVFSTSVVTVHPTSLDTHGAGLSFHSVYGTIGSWIPNTVLQPFVLVKAFPRVKSQQGIYGSEVETAFGAEAEGHLPAGFDYDILGGLQRGSYSNDSISCRRRSCKGQSGPWADKESLAVVPGGSHWRLFTV